MSGSMDPGKEEEKHIDCLDEDWAFSSSDKKVPVGVAIAYQRQLKGFKNEEEMRSQRSIPQGCGIGKNILSANVEASQPNRKSCQVFLESASIYFLCLILPTAIGFLYNLYDIWQYERETGNKIDAATNQESYYSWFTQSVYDPAVSYICDDGDYQTSYSWSIVSSMLTQTGICHDLEARTKHSVISEDVSAWNDTFTITIFSFLLAAVRIAIVQYNVPINDSDTLEAMVRVKSDHILRSNYMPTPAGTPIITKKVKMIPNAHLLSTPVDLADEANHQEDEMFGVHIDSTERIDDDALLVEPLLDSASLRGSTAPQVLPGPLAATIRRNRLYAAPRYATALFRLLYTTVTVAIALVYFRGSDFWPWYVLGSGKTSKCWDLSGGISVGMDSDFDQVRPTKSKTNADTRPSSYLLLTYLLTHSLAFSRSK